MLKTPNVLFTPNLRSVSRGQLHTPKRRYSLEGDIYLLQKVMDAALMQSSTLIGGDKILAQSNNLVHFISENNANDNIFSKYLKEL